MKRKVGPFGADKIINSVAVLALTIICSTQTLRAQAFDRIERERALAMLSTIKVQLGVKLDPAKAGTLFPIEWK